MAVDSSTPSQVSAPRWLSPLGVRTRLVASSALMLFLELALIRWTGSNVVHLSYFSNFVLLGSFLGIGIGILRSSRAKRLPYYSPVMLGLLVLVIAWKPVTVDRGSSSSVIYFTSLNTTGPPVWVILPIIFIAAAVVLAWPGRTRRPVFRRAAATDGVPVRPDRQPDRHRRLHRAVVPRRAADLVGRDRHPAVLRADDPAAQGHHHGDRGRPQRVAGARAAAGDDRGALPRVHPPR